MSLTAGELMRKAINGENVTVEEALEVYADPNNWETVTEKDVSKGCHWKWKGPVICGYELARIALKNRTDEVNAFKEEVKKELEK